MNSAGLLERFKEYLGTVQFDSIRIGISSPEKIKTLSYGEVKKVETINYRTLKPEKDGLFCARIFGPQKDWECNCGKYKRMKHRGITCEKCGVEVIQSRVRRERMGHIALVSPVCHIWFLKGIPSYLSIVLDLPVKDIESVVYFDSCIVTSQGLSPYAQGSVVSTAKIDEYVAENIEDIDFTYETGAEGIRKILTEMDLAFEVRKVEEEVKAGVSLSLKHKLSKRYRILRGMSESGIRPEWMIMTICPVIPPELRPLVPLEGGRFASSDLNDLYRRVLSRNIRLKRLLDLDAPSVIIKNEKRMLQESVDALIDNGKRGQSVRGSNKRPLKSLSGMIRGKQGRFRQNLLGKRVDYSARSVIVVDPELELYQCGLPKVMALELFKPYVYVELQRRELVANLRAAKRMVSEKLPEVWEALESVVQDRPVMLNRAPTLHRLGFQGFYPILVEGKAIRLHPLVCGAYNADFDGDTMSVHVPLGKRAQREVRELMFSEKNIISPAHGRPLMVFSQDMVLGLYFLTKKKCNVQGEGKVFSDFKDVIRAYDHGNLNIHAQIQVADKGQLVETTVGRVILYEALPEGSDIAWCNKAMRFKDLERLVYKVHTVFGYKATAKSLDKLKKLGFGHATVGGVSFGIDDVIIPDQKTGLVDQAKADVDKVEKLYRSGAITNGERYNKAIQIWAKVTEDVADAMFNELEVFDDQVTKNTKGDAEFNPIFMMLDSGARGSRSQIRQLGGVRGPMSNPSGEIIETPVLSNFKEGLSVFEYFISTHGARKGLADTALKTADAGYLTRRLVDVAQDVVVTTEDCGTVGSIEISDFEISGKIMSSLQEIAMGRVSAEDVVDPISGKLLVKEGTLIKDEEFAVLENSSVVKMRVRSPLACNLKRGVCVKCYGMDLSKSEYVDIGLAVGVIAAQSIGEPGTQLTLKTFHIGGAASGLVEENFRVARHKGTLKFKGLSTVYNPEKEANLVVNRSGRISIISEDGREVDDVSVEYGSTLLVKEDQQVKVGDKLFEWNPYGVILSDVAGVVEYVDLVDKVTVSEEFDEESGVANRVVIESSDGQLHPCIAILDGAGNELSRYYVPAGSRLLVSNGEKISAGKVVVTIPRARQKSQDITGGLPRVVELFEARSPKDSAILSDIEGNVEFGGISRGQRRVNVVSEFGEVYEYLIPRDAHIIVGNGDKVIAGQQLTTGESCVHDVLRILGPDALQRHLVQGVQEVYMAQGVKIHNKHLEVIVRQMLKKVRIVDSGDTNFIVGEAVDRVHFRSVNDAIVESGGKVASAVPILMGITKASLGTDSFIAAASFQETTRVLAEAAVLGQVDRLKCLKSNVALGRLISAGTGVPSFRDKYIGEGESALEQKARYEEELEAGLDNISLE